MDEMFVECLTETDRNSLCTAEILEKRLVEISSTHHSQCIFKHNPIVQKLRFWFLDDGTLCGQFECNDMHQGYDSMVHGGIIAAVIDASMAQCLMGHGIVAYTVELAVRYKQPVNINIPVEMNTKIIDIFKNKMFRIGCSVFQKETCKVKATAKFMRIF